MNIKTLFNSNESPVNTMTKCANLINADKIGCITRKQDKGYLYREKDYGYRQEQSEFTDDDFISCKVGEWVSRL